VSITIEATFDGNVFHPTGEVPIPPNATVRLTIESLETKQHRPTSFLKTARELNLQGPPDWAASLHQIAN
jgi:hypothetical protein